MKTYKVWANDGIVHTIVASGWNNYEGSVDFFDRTEPNKRRVKHLFYRPIAVIEIENDDQG